MVNQPRVVVDPPANVATGSASATLVAAFFRASLTVVATFVVAFGTNYLMLDATALADSDVWRISAIVGGVTALTPYASRGAGEGLWDRARQKAGNATPADVTPTPLK